MIIFINSLSLSLSLPNFQRVLRDEIIAGPGWCLSWLSLSIYVTEIKLASVESCAGN